MGLLGWRCVRLFIIYLFFGYFFKWNWEIKYGRELRFLPHLSLVMIQWKRVILLELWSLELDLGVEQVQFPGLTVKEPGLGRSSEPSCVSKLLLPSAAPTATNLPAFTVPLLTHSPLCSSSILFQDEVIQVNSNLKADVAHLFTFWSLRNFPS